MSYSKQYIRDLQERSHKRIHKAEQQRDEAFVLLRELVETSKDTKLYINDGYIKAWRNYKKLLGIAEKAEAMLR